MRLLFRPGMSTKRIESCQAKIF